MESDLSDFNDSSDSEDDRVGTVDVGSYSKGVKIEIMDGGAPPSKLGTGFVADPEPSRPAKDEHGKPWPRRSEVSDYIKVYGGMHRNPSLRLQAARGQGGAGKEIWKADKDTTHYKDWPGVLKEDWSFFQVHMGMRNLMFERFFLIDKQHLRIFGGAAKLKRDNKKREAAADKKTAKRTKEMADMEREAERKSKRR
jgi:hypothetical protein